MYNWVWDILKEKQFLDYGTTGSYWIIPPTFMIVLLKKLGLTLQNQYCFSKWDTIGNI